VNNSDIIKQYVDTGIQIPRYQFNKLNPSLLKTYLRKRMIVVKSEIEYFIDSGKTTQDNNQPGFDYHEYIKLTGELKKEYDDLENSIPKEGFDYRKYLKTKGELNPSHNNKGITYFDDDE
jgi:hypothetical protein